MLRNLLFTRIDNSQIIVFRIFFGLLMVAECWGAILTGWVKRTFVEPQFTFTFIGFEWTQFLLGTPMYYIYGFLGFLGILIALGAFYRLSTFLFALGWSLVYFMQKEHYNNHYYLVMLVSWFMVFIPANRYKSVDVWIWPSIKSNYTYLWTRLLFILQMFILYTYAALAKLYPGWTEGDFLQQRYAGVARWLDKNIEWDPLTQYVSSKEFAQVIGWLGFGFDLLIIPLLLWRKTRILAFLSALFFHLFNSITLQIGIFPYFALVLALFCFPPEMIRRIFLPKKSTYLPNSLEVRSTSSNQSLITIIFCLYIIWQVYLPVRHWLIPGDVLWTEEGHRLSWRMMLRSKSAMTTFYVVDKSDLEAKREIVNMNNYLTYSQKIRVGTRPDMIWQFAQYLGKDYAKKGVDVEVYAESMVSINGGVFLPYLDSQVDLYNTKWNYFGHQDWILDEPENYDEYRKK